MKKKVCLITPNHISTNPRLIKEAASLYNSGYNVHIIFTQHVTYLCNEDYKILNQNPNWKYDVLDWTNASRKSRFNRIYSGILQKISAFLNRKVPSLLFYKLLLNRHFYFQLKVARKADADLYIAHNAGALAVAADAAMVNDKLFAFDAEDYHRGQELSSEEIKAITTLENAYLSNAAYITAASPLIAREYEQLYRRSVSTVRNVFPRINTPVNNFSGTTIKLFWFSQAVGTNRGIQDVFKAMKALESYDIEFYIYGYLPVNVKIEFDVFLDTLQFNRPPKVFFKDPVSPDELLLLAGKYDIGFATEPGFCKNNEIALSNKIFTYLVGGNAIIFSSTPAQAHFYNQYPDIGFIYKPNDVDMLAKQLRNYLEDRNLLERHKCSSKKLYEKELNWDIEKKIFLEQINKSFS
jgi:glycosyltransferase involved in cell wall biosynthesis